MMEGGLLQLQLSVGTSTIELAAIGMLSRMQQLDHSIEITCCILNCALCIEMIGSEDIYFDSLTLVNYYKLILNEPRQIMA